MLKFEGYNIGTDIRAFDFEPMELRDHCFIEGTITGIQDVPFKAYIIEVTHDSMAEDGWTRLGQIAYVPMETSRDYDGRVEQCSMEVA